MANQMIALSGRPAQIRSPGSLAQQYGQVMNVMMQQRASERQAALAQQQIAQTRQQMDLAAAERSERSRAAQQLYEAGQIARAREESMAVTDEPTYQMWLGRLEERNPEWAAMIRQASPNYNPAYMTQLRATAEQYVNKTISTPTSSVEYAPGGEAYSVTVGGVAPPTAQEVTVIPQQQPQQNPTAPPPATTPPPADIPMGNPLQRPIAMMTGGQPAAQPLTMETAAPIIQTAVQNGNIAQNDLQALRQMVGPQMEPQLAQWMQQNNISITPEGQAAMRSAVYRPGQDAAPQMTLAQSNAVGTQFRGRDPTVGQIPGSSLVPLPRVAGEAEAQREPIPSAAAREGATTGAERRVTRIETLRGEAPTIQRDTDNLVADYDQRILAIDRFFRNPYRFSIIGPIEGRLHGALQSPVRRDAQSTWDMIVNNDVIAGIINARSQTETGGSPVGPVSDRDMQILIRMSNDLDQTGTDREQMNRLSRLRAELYRQRENAIRWYRQTMRPLGDEANEYPIRVREDVTRLYTGPDTTSNRPRNTPTRTRGGSPVRGSWGETQ